MLTISVKSNVDQVMRRLQGDLARQIPFATAKALTATAKDAQTALTREINSRFDKPIPFTQKAVGVASARKTSLSARVYLKDVQAAYLGLQITGGVRTPKKRALVLPGAGLRLNQYGNIPRGKVKALLARSDTFSGRVGNVAGIWQRTRKGLKLMLLYEPKAQYRKRFPFYEIVDDAVKRRLTANVDAAIAQAVRSAR